MNDNAMKVIINRAQTLATRAKRGVKVHPNGEEVTVSTPGDDLDKLTALLINAETAGLPEREGKKKTGAA